MPDAVIVGAGPNGLVAANDLADAGWSVVVVEEQDTPGGAVKSSELVEPGFVSDNCSAFYPLAVASPAITKLRLQDHGVSWRRSPLAVAHPTADGRAALIAGEIDGTADSLDAFAPGDGDAWRRLFELWELIGDDVLGILTGGFPPVRPAGRIAATLGPAATTRLARMGLLGVRRLAEERFDGEGGGLLLAGNALHADLSPEAPPSAVYGWVLAALAQDIGFPVPAGGAGELTAALVARLRERGGEVHCGRRVAAITVEKGRARGVRLADGEQIRASKAVLADVDAPQLYGELLAPELVPDGILRDLDNFQFDNASVKVDWTLEAPIPWTNAAVGGAGTVHIADDMDYLSRQAADLAMHRIPADPYLVLGQYSCVDPTRMPAGKEVAWAYTHVPQETAGDAGDAGLTGNWDERELDRFADRMEAQVERMAPGFRNLIRRRHISGPRQLEAGNRNLVGGAINGGTSQLHQQLVFRPTPGLGRPETPVRDLFLCSSAIHPGGGVHGACGANAARAALGWQRAGRALQVAVPAALVGATALARAKRRR